MKNKIYSLKKMLIELETNYNSKEKYTILNNIDDIIEVCKELKDELNKHNESIPNTINCQIINTLPFIFKPILKSNYFEGDYLVTFAEERTNELKEAGALDLHNKFWMEHKPIKGKVFGSIPKELMKEDTIKSLSLNGWREVTVNIIELREEGLDTREIINYCEYNYKYYVLIREEETNSYLILNYNINN